MGWKRLIRKIEILSDISSLSTINKKLGHALDIFHQDDNKRLASTEYLHRKSIHDRARTRSLRLEEVALKQAAEQKRIEHQTHGTLGELDKPNIKSDDFLYGHLVRLNREEIHLYPTFPVFAEYESNEFHKLARACIFLYLTYAKSKSSGRRVFNLDESINGKTFSGHNIQLMSPISRDNTRITGHMVSADLECPKTTFILSIFAGRSFSGQIVRLSGVYRRKMLESNKYMTWRFVIQPN